MPETGTKRKQKAWETRKKIVYYALKLFAEKGYENVSMNQIAEESGTSIGAIYHHFSGKDEIAAQATILLDEQYDEFYKELCATKENEKKTAKECLIAYFVYVQLKSAELDSLKFAYIHDLRNMTATALGVNKERAIYKNYMALLVQCKEEGFFNPEEDLEGLIQVLTQISRGLLVDWIIRKCSFDIEKQAEKLIRIVLKGLQ